MEENEELQLYRGNDYIINEHISIHQPTLDEICQYGERAYYQMIYTLTCTPCDLKWQLHSVGTDYTQISDFELFYSMLCKNYARNDTSILFGELDFSEFHLYVNKLNDEVVMYHPKQNIIIDRHIYQLMVCYLRKMHGLKRNEEVPGNESTKMILIEDAREEAQRNKNIPYRSFLKPLISTMVNIEGFKRNDNTVWDMKINAFMDSVKRIGKIRNASLLLQSGYSGYGIDIKKIPADDLNYMGELE